MSPSVLRRTTTLVLAVVALLVALAAVAGCGTGGAQASETPYCVDGQGKVYPPSYCDGGSHDGLSSAMFFYMLATWPHPYSYGQHISVTNVHVTKINAGDPAARRRYGMPARGPVGGSYRYTPPRTGSGSRVGGTRTTTRTSRGVFSRTTRSGFGGSSFRGGRR